MYVSSCLESDYTCGILIPSLSYMYLYRYDQSKQDGERGLSFLQSVEDHLLVRQRINM